MMWNVHVFNSLPTSNFNMECTVHSEALLRLFQRYTELDGRK